MLRKMSDGIIAAALALAWAAACWAAIDLLFADPAVLVFEGVAMACAALAPILCVIGWALRGLGRGAAAGRAAAGRAVRAA